MSTLATLVPPTVAGLDIGLDAERIRLSGTIALRDPNAELGNFFREVHGAAVESGLRELLVDVRELTFVNSSALRLFVDWAKALEEETPERRYQMVFLTKPGVTWQRTAFPALLGLAKGLISVRRDEGGN